MLTLRQIPAWNDNYIWMLDDGRQAWVVDAPEAGPVLEALAEHGLQLEAVLNTHHHGDHVGGNLELKEKTGCRILGPAHDEARIPGITEGAVVGQTVSVLGLALRVLDVRAHTRGHICYALDEKVDRVVRHGHDGAEVEIPRLAGRPVLFVGDSLFLAGCGRLFEGTPADLRASMEVYRAESPEALVCCAHEYTASNLRFAVHVLPDVPAVGERAAALDEERGASGSSVPDTLARERATNPFLLAFEPERQPGLWARVGGEGGSVEALLGALRAAKDNF